MRTLTPELGAAMGLTIDAGCGPLLRKFLLAGGLLLRSAAWAFLLRFKLFVLRGLAIFAQF